MSLTLRQSKILATLVREFILTAEPVSSGILESKLENICSSATIRAEMAELERRGYLQRPHISSGRVPTHNGYRYYVDYLMSKEDLSLEEQYTIKLELEKRIYQIDQLLNKTLSLISNYTRHLSLVVPPNLNKVVIKDIHLISINPYSILIVILTTTGIIINRVIDNTASLVEDEIKIISNFLSDKLIGVSFNKIDYSILGEDEQFSQSPLVKMIIDEIKCALTPEIENKILWGGTQNLLSKPEFKDVDKLKGLLDILENRGYPELFDISSGVVDVRVTIGEEHKFKEMYDCSIISAYYRVAGEAVGTLGILGPTRMHYSRMVPMVSFIANSFSKMLNRINS